MNRLEIYASLLRNWQNTINLVAPSTLDAVWQRHFADSAQLLALAPVEARTWLDLGSGGGFPGLVLAILLQNDNSRAPPASFKLIESDARKAAFLKEVARQTEVAVDILNLRIEKVAIHARFDSDVITARALAPLDRLLPLVSAFFSVKSKALLLKGRTVETEIQDANRAWQWTFECVPSLTDREASIIVISDLQAKSEG